MNYRIITTPRLTLGVIRECDFDAMMAIFKSDVVKATYMVPDLETREAEINLFERLRDLSLREDRYVFGIFLDGKLIGLLNDTEICGKTIEVGYALHPDYWAMATPRKLFQQSFPSSSPQALTRSSPAHLKQTRQARALWKNAV